MIDSKHPQRIVTDDIVNFCKFHRGERFHALLCDPPYHLTSITKRFGKNGAKAAKFCTDGAFTRSSRGFMGKTWDGGDIAFRPETWELLGDLLYPGAFGMAFASSRGWHRLAVAIEDAGFIIHPSIFGWAFSSGFPKATRIDTQLDKQSGVERPVVGILRHGKSVNIYGKLSSDNTGKQVVTAPMTDMAKVWEGHRYGAQALKPALEPIIVFQKPYVNRPVDSIVGTGAGTFNIDMGRIGDSTVGWKAFPSNGYGSWDNKESGGRPVKGRWPANLVTVNAPDPSDFFFNADWHYEVAEQLNDADPVFYTDKASTEERERGLTEFPVKLASELTGRKAGSAGLSGNTELGYDHNPNAKVTTDRRNVHPTVKPIALTEYLAKLLLPPEFYAPRSILVPFAGSGSEVIGAYLAGWERVVGIERDSEYAHIARARLHYYQSYQGRQLELFG